VGAALRRLESVDPSIEAFVSEPTRRHRLESSPSGDGPLQGVAVGVKDLYRVDGIPTRAGSQLPAAVFEGEESSIVTTLRDAGATVLGKTAMDEFAYCEPPPTKNPRDPERTPGGSSGGSAAAVASGICRLAVGSQTLQSVVVPAAYCGVVGYKASFGRAPFDGIPLSPSLDTVGFLAQTVADLRADVASLIPDWRETGPTAPPILGVLEAWGAPEIVADGWSAHRRHLETLRDRGVELRPVVVPWNDPGSLRDWGRRVGDLLHGEMALAHAGWFDRFAHLYRPRTAKAVQHGRTIPAERVLEGRRARGDLAALLQDSASASGIDAWVCPATVGVAPIGYEETGDGTMTAFWSYAGFPSITLPVFDGTDGMPLGIQLVAPPGRDEQLLVGAEQLEAMLAHDRPALPTPGRTGETR
jgi:Asp-tRNA(Asn)/Glu-tRNA(Gln) amidotransferase A subunit family amidase